MSKDVVANRISHDPVVDESDDAFAARIASHTFSRNVKFAHAVHNPALVHFMFDEHGDPDVGNETLYAAEYLSDLFDDYAGNFADVRREIKMAIERNMTNAGLVAGKYWSSDVFNDSVESMGVPMTIVVAIKGVSNHQSCIVIRRPFSSRHGTQQIGMEITFVNSGDGVQFHDTGTAFMSYENLVDYDEATSREQVVKKLTDLFEAIAEVPIEGSKRKRAPASQEEFYTNAKNQLKKRGFDRSQGGFFPESIVQRSGSCTFYSLWNALAYTMCNCYAYVDHSGTRPGLRATSLAVDRMQKFSTCHMAAHIIRTAFSPVQSEYVGLFGDTIASGESCNPATIVRMLISGMHPGFGFATKIDTGTTHPEIEDIAAFANRAIERLMHDRSAPAANRVGRFFSGPKMTKNPGYGLYPHDVSSDLPRYVDAPVRVQKTPTVTSRKTGRTAPLAYRASDESGLSGAISFLFDKMTEYVNVSSRTGGVRDGLHLLSIAMVRTAAADAALKCFEARGNEEMLVRGRATWLGTGGGMQLDNSKKLVKFCETIPIYRYFGTPSTLTQVQRSISRTQYFEGSDSILFFLFVCVSALFESSFRSRTDAAKIVEIEKTAFGIYDILFGTIVPQTYSVYSTTRGDAFPMSAMIGWLSEKIAVRSTTGRKLGVEVILSRRRFDVCVPLYVKVFDESETKESRDRSFEMIPYTMPRPDVGASSEIFAWIASTASTSAILSCALACTPSTCERVDVGGIDVFAVFTVGKQPFSMPFVRESLTNPKGFDHVASLDAMNSVETVSPSAAAESARLRSQYTSTPAIAPTSATDHYATERWDATSLHLASLNDRTIRDLKLQYEAARTSHCLRRIDILSDRTRSLAMLIAAYGFAPEALIDALGSDAMRPIARSKLSSQISAHLTAVAEFLRSAGDEPTKRRSARRNVHLTAAAMERSAAVAFAERGTMSSLDSPLRSHLNSAMCNYYNFLASHPHPDDAELCDDPEMSATESGSLTDFLSRALHAFLLSTEEIAWTDPETKLRYSEMSVRSQEDVAAEPQRWRALLGWSPDPGAGDISGALVMRRPDGTHEARAGIHFRFDVDVDPVHNLVSNARDPIVDGIPSVSEIWKREGVSPLVRIDKTMEQRFSVWGECDYDDPILHELLDVDRTAGKFYSGIRVTLPRVWSFSTERRVSSASDGRARWSIVYVVCGVGESSVVLVKTHVESPTSKNPPDVTYTIYAINGSEGSPNGPLVSGVVVAATTTSDATAKVENLMFTRWLARSRNAVVVKNQQDGEYWIVHFTFLPAHTGDMQRYSQWLPNDENEDAKKIEKLTLRGNPSYSRELTLVTIKLNFSGLYAELEWDYAIFARVFFAACDNLEGIVSSGKFGRGPRSRGGGPSDSFSRGWLDAARASTFEWSVSECTAGVCDVAEFGKRVKRWFAEHRREPATACETADGDGWIDWFRDGYKGCCRPAHTTRKRITAWRKEVDALLVAFDVERNDRMARVAVDALKAVVGVSDEYLKEFGRTGGRGVKPKKMNPWPECAAERLAISPVALGKWVYLRLAERALTTTRRRLDEVLALGDDSQLTCSVLLYAFELVDATVVDYRHRRRLPDILAELSSGFFMRRDQRRKLAKIDANELSGGRTGIVRQMIMGGGKTSFLIPRLTFSEILRGPSASTDKPRSVVVVMPSSLVAQGFDVVRRASAALGFVDAIYASEGDYKRLNDEPWKKTHGFQLKKSGAVVVAADKAVQRMFLKKLDKSSGAVEWLPWSKRSLVICDEVDSVVDPMSCEMNVPDPSSVVENPTMLRDVVRRIVYGRAMRAAAELPEALEEKITRAEDEADGMHLNKDYGLAVEKVVDLRLGKSGMCAIPFRGANDPMFGSRFTDFELRLVLTFRAYRVAMLERSIFRMDDYLELVKAIRKTASKVMWTKGTLEKMLPHCGDAAIEALLYYDQSGNRVLPASDVEAWLRTEKDQSKRNGFFLQYISHLLLSQGVAYKRQHSVGMLEFLSPNLCRHCVMFSGTVNVHLPNKVDSNLLPGPLSIETVIKDVTTKRLVNAIVSGFSCDATKPPKKRKREKEDIDEPESAKPAPKKRKTIEGEFCDDSKVLGYDVVGAKIDESQLTDPAVAVVSGAASWSELEDRVLRMAVSKSIERRRPGSRVFYSAVMDAAGVLRTGASIYYAKKLVELSGADVLFVDEDGERKIVRAIDGSISTRSSAVSEVGDAVRKIVFYDQKNTKGIDFKQGPFAHGLVIVDRRTTWTAVAQAAFRLRRLSRGHTIDFLLISAPGSKADDENETKFAKAMSDPCTRVQWLMERERESHGSARDMADLSISAAALRTAKLSGTRVLDRAMFSRELWVDTVASTGTSEKAREGRRRIAIKEAENLARGVAARPDRLDAKETKLQVQLIDAAILARGSADWKRREIAVEREVRKETKMETETRREVVAVADPGLFLESRFGTADDVAWLRGEEAKKAVSPIISVFVDALIDRFPPVVFSAGAMFAIAREAHGVRVSSGTESDFLPFLVAYYRIDPGHLETAYVCTHVDALAFMHKPPAVDGAKVAHFSDGTVMGVSVGSKFADPEGELRRRSIRDMSSDPRFSTIFSPAMLTWCLRWRSRVDVFGAEKSTFDLLVMSNMRRIYEPLLRGDESADVEFRKFAEPLGPAPRFVAIATTASSPPPRGTSANDPIDLTKSGIDARLQSVDDEIGTHRGRMIEARMCAICSRPAKFRCGGCHVALFCSRECQATEWTSKNRHKCISSRGCST